jgi:hypothetical protein
MCYPNRQFINVERSVNDDFNYHVERGKRMDTDKHRYFD